MMLECPKCRIDIGTASGTGSDEVVCPKCRYQYLVWSGRVAKRFSKQITEQRKTKKQDGVYRRSYEFRLELPNGSVEVFEFEIPGKEDRIQVRARDEAAFVFSGRDGDREELVEVRNLTLGKNFRLAKPGSTARGVAGCLALLATIGAGLALWRFGIGGGAAVVALVATPVVTFIALSRALTPQVHRDSDRVKTAQTGHQFLVKKRELLRLRDGQHAEMDRSLRLRQQLQSLLEKMESVGEEAYGTRIEGAKAGVRLLNQLIELDERMIAEYTMAITIIEIEYESHEISSSALEGVPHELEERLALLGGLKLEYEDTRRQLEANEELERYLS